MFKQFDKEDYKLDKEDVEVFKKNQAKSFKEHKKLCKWESAVKFKQKRT